MSGLDDALLESALRELASAIDWPDGDPSSPDLATRVRIRLIERRVSTPWRSSPGWRHASPFQRALVLALAAALLLAALAGAAGLGLPGLRIILGEPSALPPAPPRTASPTATATADARAPGTSVPGAQLGLGQRMPIEEAEALLGRPIRLPADPSLGPPDAVFVDPARANQLALVWAPRSGLPETSDPSVGLIVMSFDGTVKDGLFQKVVGEASHLERVAVAGHPGWWITGAPHLFFYESPDGTLVDDERRWVGDALIWADGPTTYRIEGATGRAAAIAIAESMP